MREAWSWDNHLVNLTCRAESIPNATISWFLNGRNLENDYNILTNAFNGESTITVLYFDLIIIKGTTNLLLLSSNGCVCVTHSLIYGTYQVTPIDLSYYGTYRCLAMNIHGKDEHAIELREARAPGPLLQTKFETITGMCVI